MFPIHIDFIPHKDQRYKTVGDWYYLGEEWNSPLQIKISIMRDWRYMFLVALHELVEAIACYFNGIHQSEIDAFDIQFEKDKMDGKHGTLDEPGDDLMAPYHLQHSLASGIERIMAFSLKVPWIGYCEAVEEL